MAQYAPQAGIAGSTAVSATSGLIIGWASSCNVQRGYIDIANTAAGTVTGGDPTNGLGPADGTIVCLGDSGTAELMFMSPLYNGPGPDFAVFENGFKDPADPAMAFLEFAFVEVSSDGVNYYRFPANSYLPINTQIPGSGVYMDATKVNGLAGKYISMYGTPFDLEDLAGQSGLDVNNILRIRLVDVIGSVSGHSCLDSAGRIINDPYPTNFPSGGFDLDAVAALHMYPTSVASAATTAVSVYPNPAHNTINISLPGITLKNTHATLMSITGAPALQAAITNERQMIDIAQLAAGIYFLTIANDTQNIWWGKIAVY